MDAHNITLDTFSHISNTHIENENVILTSEKLEKLDDLPEKLNNLTINNAEYYVSNSANENDTKVDPERDTEKVTHTSDRKKRKVADTSNVIL